jgi:hypothetical protein
MTANPHAALAARKYHRSYDEIRIAVNRIVNAGWNRPRAEQYIDEVLAVGNDLGRAVEAVLRESPAASPDSETGQ